MRLFLLDATGGKEIRFLAVLEAIGVGPVTALAPLPGDCLASLCEINKGQQNTSRRFSNRSYEGCCALLLGSAYGGVSVWRVDAERLANRDFDENGEPACMKLGMLTDRGVVPDSCRDENCSVVPVKAAIMPTLKANAAPAALSVAAKVDSLVAWSSFNRPSEDKNSGIISSKGNVKPLFLITAVGRGIAVRLWRSLEWAPTGNNTNNVPVPCIPVQPLSPTLALNLSTTDALNSPHAQVHVQADVAEPEGIKFKANTLLSEADPKKDEDCIQVGSTAGGDKVKNIPFARSFLSIFICGGILLILHLRTPLMLLTTLITFLSLKVLLGIVGAFDHSALQHPRYDKEAKHNVTKQLTRRFEKVEIVPATTTDCLIHAAVTDEPASVIVLNEEKLLQQCAGDALPGEPAQSTVDCELVKTNALEPIAVGGSKARSMDFLAAEDFAQESKAEIVTTGLVYQHEMPPITRNLPPKTMERALSRGRKNRHAPSSKTKLKDASAVLHAKLTSTTSAAPQTVESRIKALQCNILSIDDRRHAGGFDIDEVGKLCILIIYPYLKLIRLFVLCFYCLW